MQSPDAAAWHEHKRSNSNCTCSHVHYGEVNFVCQWSGSILALSVVALQSNHAPNECMSAWMTEWMNGCMHGWMNEWRKEWIDECMNKWMNAWMTECMRERKNKSMNKWLNKQMSKRTHKWEREWMIAHAGHVLWLRLPVRCGQAVSRQHWGSPQELLCSGMNIVTCLFVHSFHLATCLSQSTGEVPKNFFALVWTASKCFPFI